MPGVDTRSHTPIYLETPSIPAVEYMIKTSDRVLSNGVWQACPRCDHDDCFHAFFEAKRIATTTGIRFMAVDSCYKYCSAPLRNILLRELTEHRERTIILDEAVHRRRIHVDASRSDYAFNGCIHQPIESHACGNNAGL